jgi:hypothetical protein
LQACLNTANTNVYRIRTLQATEEIEDLQLSKRT